MVDTEVVFVTLVGVVVSPVVVDIVEVDPLVEVFALVAFVEWVAVVASAAVAVGIVVKCLEIIALEVFVA